MKLLTLNCHSWQEENQIDKMKYLAKVILDRDYEVVALQEVNQLKDNKILYSDIREGNFIDLLSKELKELGAKYDYKWDYHHIGYDIFHEGTGILFKGDAKEIFSEFIGECKDPNFWKTRKFTMISKIISEETIDFYSCHMGWWNDIDNSFEKQLDDLLNFANGRGNRYFLMGDFNNSADIKNEGYEYLLKCGLIDTYTEAIEKDCGITVPGTIAGWEGKCSNPKRIDFIFTNKKCEVKLSEVIFNDKNEKIVSDHFGVNIDIKI